MPWLPTMTSGDLWSCLGATARLEASPDSTISQTVLDNPTQSHRVPKCPLVHSCKQFYWDRAVPGQESWQAGPVRNRLCLRPWSWTCSLLRLLCDRLTETCEMQYRRNERHSPESLMREWQNAVMSELWTAHKAPHDTSRVIQTVWFNQPRAQLRKDVRTERRNIW